MVRNLKHLAQYINIVAENVIITDFITYFEQKLVKIVEKHLKLLTTIKDIVVESVEGHLG